MSNAKKARKVAHVQNEGAGAKGAKQVNGHYAFPPIVVERLERARNMVFEAHSIAAVAAAASVSERPIKDEQCMATTLGLVATMLDNAAYLINPSDLAHETGVSHE